MSVGNLLFLFVIYISGKTEENQAGSAVPDAEKN